MGQVFVTVAKRRIIEDLDMRIARDGTWYHEGRPIRRQELVRLFASALTRADNGSFWLETPVEAAQIEVEDVPFIVEEMRRHADGCEQVIDFRTNVGEWVGLDDSHGLRFETNEQAPGEAPYLMVRAGLEARLSTSVYYELVDCAVVGDDGRVGVWSRGMFHFLGLIE